MKKLLTLVLFVVLAVLLVVVDMRRREAEAVVENLSVVRDQVQRENEEQNREVAREIIEKVSALMEIETDPEPTVATIIDVEQLRERNSFYDKAENGDHLVITADRAILYDPEEDKIIDVIPVQIQDPAAADAQASAAVE